MMLGIYAAIFFVALGMNAVFGNAVGPMSQHFCRRFCLWSVTLSVRH